MLSEISPPTTVGQGGYGMSFGMLIRKFCYGFNLQAHLNTKQSYMDGIFGLQHED